MAAPPVGNADRCILAVLAAIVAITAVATIVSVVLRPAHIHFSIIEVGNASYYEDLGLRLVVTLAVNNTSQRAAVRYRSMHIILHNSTGDGSWPTSPEGMPLDQRRNSTAYVVERLWFDPDWSDDFFAGNTTSCFTMMVSAAAQFKMGIAWTRRYAINVTCGTLSILPTANHTVNADWSVDCN